MKILHCDCCHAEVNDYSHWYNDAQPRNMYELKCMHESDLETYDGMIIWHKCIAKLLHKAKSEEINMSKSILIIDTPKTCGDCPLCIFSADEKRSIGFCHTSDEDYYCKILDRFMEYDEVDGGLDILGKPTDCPLKAESEIKE